MIGYHVCGLLCVFLFVLRMAVPQALADESSENPPKQCSYSTYEWSTVEKRAVNARRVAHPYASLSNEEIDPITGCTVCEEDQRWVSLGQLEPFRVCRHLAEDIRHILAGLLGEGIPLKQIVAYRAGRTRGEINRNGLRTQFSNHAYGTAIDINPQYNGLYDQCLTFGPGCRLIRGGQWHPHHPASLTADGPVVRAFKNFGYRWGGEIEGRQKDFMHFSPTGY